MADNDSKEVQPRVIGIAGHARSGKTTAGEYLSNQLQAEHLVNSRLLGEIARKIGGPPDRSFYADVANAIFDVFGRDIIAKHWLDFIRKNGNTIYVIDGIRYPEELLLYRERTRFFLVGIESEDEIRYRRSKSAADFEKDKSYTFDEFCQTMQQKNESLINDILLQADARLCNNGSLSQFEKSLSFAIKDFVL